MKKENVIYKCVLDDEVFYDKEEVIWISEDILIKKDLDSGIIVDKVAKTSKGHLVFVEEIFHINVNKKVVDLFDIDELAGLSALGLLIKLVDMTIGRDAS